jgi:Cof subfamily protein (haloacid dehalogenase superfamily)
MKLFATDLDGTLLHPGDTIHERDLAALASARARGVLVTIATGRLTSRTHHVSRSLGLDLPLICADGCVIACATTERVLQRTPIPALIALRALEILSEAGLASFVFTTDVIHSCMRGTPYHSYMRGWAESILAHDDLRAADALQNEPEAAVILFGIGERTHVHVAERALAEHAASIDINTFTTGAGEVLRIASRGTSKGAALAALAQQLGIARENVAVAGDYLNDLSMFAFAGRSFAMPHAIAEVRAAATHPLDHDIAEHGSFADALEQWLDEG